MFAQPSTSQISDVERSFGQFYSESNTTLTAESIFDNDGQFEKDLVEVNMPRPFKPTSHTDCHQCKGRVTDENCDTNNALYADGYFFHRNCFNCTRCRRGLTKPFNIDFRVTAEKVLMCIECYMELNHPRCDGCGGVLQEDCYIAAGRKWHSQCFRCARCQRGMPNGEYMVHEEIAFCEDCYYVANLEDLVETTDAEQLTSATSSGSLPSFIPPAPTA